MPKNKGIEMKLKKVEKVVDVSLKKQAREGLSKIYKEVGCGAVAREIKAGRNVTGNAEYGIRICVHPKVAATVDPTTLKFFPQTKKQGELEKKFIENVNKMLSNAGYKKMSASLLSNLKKKDKKFEQDIKKRREKNKK